MQSSKGPLILVVLSLLLLGGAIAVVVVELRGAGEFPWGIHMITIPAVFLVGLIAGWVMCQRQVDEQRARDEIEAE